MEKSKVGWVLLLAVLAAPFIVRATVTLTENNVTADGNMTALYFCNSTDCRTLLQLDTDTDTDTWNTTAEIQTVISANPTGNTTAQIQAVIVSNPTGNTTSEIQAVISANPTGNTTSEIQAVIAANPTGNTTTEIRTAVNGSDATLTNLYITRNLVNLLGYNNLTKCSDTQVLKMSGASWACAADATGSASGTNYWQVYGALMSPNVSAGGKNYINITGLNVTTIELANTLLLGWGNLTNVPAVGNTTAEIQAVISANPTGNTTAEIQTVISANPTGNTTAEMLTVIQANPQGNTTTEIRTAINSSSTSLHSLILQQGLPYGIAWGNLTGVPAVGNTTAEIQTVISANPTGNTTAQIQAVIVSNPTGNTTTEIQTAINGSRITLPYLVMTGDLNMSNQNITFEENDGDIYDNGTCIIITKGTTELAVCE